MIDIARKYARRKRATPVDDGNVTELLVGANGSPKWRVQVAGEQLDLALLGRLERGQEPRHRGFAPAVPDPNRLTRAQVARDSHELVIQLVAATKPLLVESHFLEDARRPGLGPALNGRDF